MASLVGRGLQRGTETKEVQALVTVLGSEDLQAVQAGDCVGGGLGSKIEGVPCGARAAKRARVKAD